MVWESPEDRVAILSCGEVTVTLSRGALEEFITECEHVYDLLSLDVGDINDADRACETYHHDADDGAA